jgi:hypothetical protein
MTEQIVEDKKRWTFFGRVLPERFSLSIGTPFAGEVAQPDFGTRAKFRTVLHASQLIVTLEVIEGELDVFSLRNLAAQCAEHYTDLIGYTYGGHFSVEIVSAVSGDNWQIFGIQIPAIADRQNPHRKLSLDSDLVVAVGGSPHAANVLRDYQHAMRDPIGTGFHCYRAIEAMMQAMKSETVKDDKAAWAALNSALRLDSSAALFVKKYADYPRHGKPWSMSDADRVNVFGITDEIVYRYLELLRRGAQALPHDEFAVLTNAVVAQPVKK